MDEMTDMAGDVPPPKKKPISKWEWLPPIAVVIMAVLYFFVAAPGGGLARFCFFVGLSLVPGSLWRLTGRSSIGIHRLFFAAGLIAFMLNNPDLRPDRQLLARCLENWPLLVVGTIASLTQPIWGGLRTRRLLTDTGINISKWESVKLSLVGTFFNLFLPGSTGGDAYRVFVVTKGIRGRLARVIASISLDRILGLPALILVLFAGILMDYRFFQNSRVLGKLIPFIAIVGLFCIALMLYLNFVRKRNRHRINTTVVIFKQKSWTKRVHDMIATNFKRGSTLPLVLLFGVLSHLACIACCQLFGDSLGVTDVPAVRYYLIVPLAMTINAIPGAPGGIGQGELAMATLLNLAAPGSNHAQEGVMIMLLFRLTNILMGLVGGLFYAFGNVKFDRKTAESSRRFLDGVDPAESGHGD